MRWPWQRRETREAQPFTDAIVAALAAQAAGTVAGDPNAIAALETAAGLWARAFAAARLEPAVPAVTPAVMALIGRDLIRRGESVFSISIEGGAPVLIEVGSWDVRGPWREPDWFYRIDLFGPSGNITRFVPSASVIHCRYAIDPSRPWFGISPLTWARATGALAANLEQRLGEEAGQPVGAFLPLPFESGGAGDDDDDDRQAILRRDVAMAKGRQVFVETTAAGHDQGRVAAPQKDWQPNRFGASPPEVLDKLRSHAGEAVLNACGVPVSLAMDADGTGQREAWRRFVMGSVEPIGRVVAEELARKLDVPGLHFDFSSLWAHDLAGRASAFKAMVGAGMDLDRAAGLSGLLADGAA